VRCRYPDGYPMIHPSLQDRDFELLQVTTNSTHS
jgi:hypothetical protein